MRSRATAVALHPLTVACAVAAVTIARQGFDFGFNNNVFHVPIVLGWAALPQFADDPTIQSLSAFVTPLFPALGLIVDEGHIRTGFFLMHVVTRVLTCLALYRLIVLFGVTNPVGRLAALAAACLVTPAFGYSPLGKAGLFLGYFTHTELAQAIALFSLGDLAAGRLHRGGWLAGIAFLINAFVGGWLILPFAWVAARTIAVRSNRHAAVRAALAGACGYAACAAPVIIWMLRLPPDPVTFDYRAYLRDYYPGHFFMDWSALEQHARAAALLAVTGASMLVLPRAGTRSLVKLLGMGLALFAVGVVAGEWATNRFILNLHLLRVDGLIVWVCLAATGAGLAVALESGRILPVMAAAFVVAALTVADRHPGVLLVAAGMLLLVAGRGSRLGSLPATRLTPAVVLSCFVLALCLSHLAFWRDSTAPWPIPEDAPPTDRHLVGQPPARPEWAAVKTWADAHTPPDALFLTPLHLEDFRIGARRRTWVTWKEGATAMWAPRTYHRWRTRHDEVSTLASVEAVLAYAERHGIDFVVLDKRVWSPAAMTQARNRLAFENRWFAVARGHEAAEAGFDAARQSP